MDEPQPQPISYAEFGHNFIRHVVTAERIRGEIETTLKAMIEGSVKKFPADLLVASYSFQLRDVDVTPILSRLPQVSFLMELAGDMQLEVKFVNLRFKFSLDVKIRLHLDVFTHAPLTIRIVVHEARSADVTTEIDGHDLPSGVLEQLRIVGPIVRDEIVREVNARLASPELVAATNIDVLAIAASAQFPGLGSIGAAEPLAHVEGHADASWNAPETG
ncbi:MAG TPA: hypothetical protein VJM11_12575 [Nevskiaceae bacterium]|nr:hypothetical protein [Nevskiaceae bacterium]